MPGSKKKLEIFNGSVFIGDLRVELAHPDLEFSSTEDGKRELTLRVRVDDSQEFSDALKKCVHNTLQQQQGFAQTSLTPADSTVSVQEHAGRAIIHYRDVHYADVHYKDVSYCDIDATGARKVDVQYADVVYSEVHYVDVSYSDSKSREVKGPDDAQAPEPGLDLTVVGETHDGRRQVVNLQSIICFDACDLGSGRVEVIATFQLDIPLERLVWLVEGE